MKAEVKLNFHIVRLMFNSCYWRGKILKKRLHSSIFPALRLLPLHSAPLGGIYDVCMEIEE